MGMHAVSSECSISPYGGKKRYFSCFPLSITLCNGASICKYKAYWHVNVSLINECGTHTKIMFDVILSFEMALVSSPILQLLPKK